MNTKAIARLICELIESRDWTSWKGEGILQNTYLTKGQVGIGTTYLSKKKYIKHDKLRGRGWWTRTKKFSLWKFFLGTSYTRLNMQTGKLRLV